MKKKAKSIVMPTNFDPAFKQAHKISKEEYFQLKSLTLIKFNIIQEKVK
jgi:hypothetical protein